MTETEQQIRETAIEELQDGARGPQAIAHRVNKDHRKRAVVEGNDEDKIDATDAKSVLEEMASEGRLERLDSPEGWYQLANWEERPTRVTGVSHHITSIAGIDQIDEVWLDESIRAARYEHGIYDDHLKPMKTDDRRRMYDICTRHHDVLMQYRETLLRLAEEIGDSNPEKATLYERLADATDIEDQFETRDEEIVLRDRS